MEKYNLREWETEKYHPKNYYKIKCQITQYVTALIWTLYIPVRGTKQLI